MNCKIYRFDPMYEILDELPEITDSQNGRYVYIPDDDIFYILSHGEWLPLGIQFPISSNTIQLKLSDSTSAVKAITIPCWTEDYISNIQLVLEDFDVDLTNAKKTKYLIDNGIKNFHVDNLGFNKFSANSLFLTTPLGSDIDLNVTSNDVLTAIVKFDDTTTHLTKNNQSGLYLGDPCFTISDSLILDANFLSILGADDISYDFFDSNSNIQFAIDNISINIIDRGFTNLTGIPNGFGDETNYLRSNGVDWSIYSIISADEIFAPLENCREDCECLDPNATTVSLQQSICQLFKNKYECVDYIKFEHLANTDVDLSLLMPPVEPTDVIPRIIYDIRTDDVWVWNCDTWIIDECKSVCKLETNKMYFNTVTRKLFYVACDCSVYCLLCLPFTGNICE